MSPTIGATTGPEEALAPSPPPSRLLRAGSLSSHCAQLQAPPGHSLSLGGVGLSREGGGGLELQLREEGEVSGLLKGRMQPLGPLLLPEIGLHPEVQPSPHPSPFPQAPPADQARPPPQRPSKAKRTLPGTEGAQHPARQAAPQARPTTSAFGGAQVGREEPGMGVGVGGRSLGLEEGRKARTEWRDLEPGVGDGKQVGLGTREGLGLWPPKAAGVGGRVGPAESGDGVGRGAVGREGPGRPSAYLQPGGDSE